MRVKTRVNLALLVYATQALDGSASAQNGLQLEEIVVTAQKRAQSLADVPISVSVVDTDFISQRNMVSLSDITEFTPNVSVTNQTLAFSVISFRGLAGGFDRGFEQSAGVYVDGVFSGRVASSTSDLGDIARVEVLRGPQGTLFGNNTITGTFNVVTNQPNEEVFEGQVGVTVGEDNEVRYNLMLSGPLSNSLSYRFFGAHREIDGYLENQARYLEGGDKWMGDLDKNNWRAKLLWRPNSQLEAVLSYSGSSGNSNQGLASEMYLDRPVEDLRTEVFDLPVWPVWQALVPDIVVDQYDRVIAHNTKSDFDLDAQQIDLTVSYDYGESILTSITSYGEYRDRELYDNDFSPANFLVRNIREDYDQFTQEFRLTSPVSDVFEYVAGLYFLSSKIDLDNTLTLDFSDYGVVMINDKVKSYQQDYTSMAAYGQATFFLSEALSLTAGLRYSYESKSADISHTYANCNFLGVPVPDPVACSRLPGVAAKGEIYEIDESRTDDNFSPMLNIGWEINEDWNSYARLATGFKSGGFSSDNSFLGDNKNQFDPETSLTYELGLKGSILGGAGRINVAAFYTEFDDLQVSTFTGAGGFSIGNAASATTQGVEIDAQILLAENFDIIATLGYTRARYNDYEDAGCTQAQRELFLEDPANISGDSCTQDLTSKVLFRAPDWNGSIAARYKISTGYGVNWFLGVDMTYTGQFYYATDLDKVDSQNGYAQLHCQLGLIDDGGEWEALLRGKNLTNEDVYGGGSDLPLVYGAHGGGLQRESHWALDLKYNF